MSRQLEWQQRMLADGKCRQCGKKPLLTKHYCLECTTTIRQRQRTEYRRKHGLSLDSPTQKRRPPTEEL